jgi:hypothetical protein
VALPVYGIYREGRFTALPLHSGGLRPLAISDDGRTFAYGYSRPEPGYAPTSLVAVSTERGAETVIATPESFFSFLAASNDGNRVLYHLGPYGSPGAAMEFAPGSPGYGVYGSGSIAGGPR